MALRTIPVIVGYAREVARARAGRLDHQLHEPGRDHHAGGASGDRARIIGICDTPTELFEEIAHALDLPSAECYFDYFGLNHLGWVREVYHRGEPQLHACGIATTCCPASIAPRSSSPNACAHLRLLPTEYVYYYYRAGDAYEQHRARRHQSRRGHQRPQPAAVQRPARTGRTTRCPSTRRIWPRAVPATCRSSRARRRRSRARRGPSSPATTRSRSQPSAAIHFNQHAIIPLNVENRGNLPELEPADVVEVPCVVNANGALRDACRSRARCGARSGRCRSRTTSARPSPPGCRNRRDDAVAALAEQSARCRRAHGCGIVRLR